MTAIKDNKSTPQAYHVGSLVWVPEVVLPSSPRHVNKRKATRWVRGRVVSLQPGDSGLLEVETEEGTHLTLTPDECPLQNERDDTVDDLVKSDFLHEPGILHTLRVRYSLDMIYTYSANILIAANPHKRLRHLYGPRMMTQYRGVPLGELSPHVYAIAEQAFSAMMIDEQPQAILVSGESGAGKTESAKMVMQYLANRTNALQTGFGGGQRGATLGRGGSPRKALLQQSSGLNRSTSIMQSPETASVEDQVLESNPLLEAFGNAKTSRNDNSSRFGKFVDIYFDVSGRVSGAFISTYLLERSRVVSINAPERSYHIFYQLCAGASPDQKKKLGLGSGAEEFHYLRQSGVYVLDDVDDGEAFRDTLDAMAIIGLAEEEQEAVLQVVAAVLHLGNVTFAQSSSDESQLADEPSRRAARTVAALLEVPESMVIKALTTRTIEMRGDKIVKGLDVKAATDSRDALAKTLYSRLFDWLVAAINRKISALGTGKRSSRTIGILDIYGFESFKENSFEQLCINLANERLQQQFNQHVFKDEQEEYAREGIDWSSIEFVDNQDCLDLLEGGALAAGLGIFPFIDEACRIPRATFQDLAHTLRTRLTEHPRFGAPKRPPHAFIVDHYAGKVCYSTELLLEKNKDYVIQEHTLLVASSGIDFIRNLFNDIDAEEPAAGAKPSQQQQRSAYKLNSVGARFRQQLKGLMATLSECQPHYIRCIKPNPESRPGNLVPGYVLEQLRAGGVLEAVRIACAGFPTRKAFRQFAQRYNLLLSMNGAPYTPLDADSLEEDKAAELCRKILQALKLQAWQIGKTRVFLRAGQLAQLEGARGRRLTLSAIKIQSAFRGLRARRVLVRARWAATRIQATWRGQQGRAVAAEVRRDRAAERIQAAWRMHHARSAYLEVIRNRRATVIQASVRMWLQRNRYRRDTIAGKKAAARAAERKRLDDAAIVIQKHARRMRAQRKAAQLRKVAAKWKNLLVEREELRGRVEMLEEEVVLWKSKHAAADSRAIALAATLGTVESSLAATRLELQAARKAADDAMQTAQAATVHASQTAAEAAEAAQIRVRVMEESHVREREAAQTAAQAAMIAEMEVIRRQKNTAEDRVANLEGQVRDLHQSIREHRADKEAVMAAAAAKDEENSKLWEQVKAAANEYHADFMEKDATIEALRGELAQLQTGTRSDIGKLRNEIEAEVATSSAIMAVQLEEAKRQMEARVQALNDSNAKNIQIGARLLSSQNRARDMERRLREAEDLAQRLRTENDALKKASADAAAAAAGEEAEPVENGKMEMMRKPAPAAAEVTPLSRLAALNREQEEALALLVAGVVRRSLQIVNISWGPKTTDSIGMPVAAWLLGECLMYWAMRWRPAQVDSIAVRLRDSIVQNSELEGLQIQAYWLSTTLALGAFLKVRSIGKKDCGSLFKLGDDMIQFTQLHAMLSASVAQMLPVNISQLLSENAKRLARKNVNTTNNSSALERSGSKKGNDTEPLSFESLMNSPWKGLLGGLSTVIEVLRGEGAPPAAVRAVVYAALCYLDAELLNALVLRRDCCSISGIKALQSGLNDVKAWLAYMGATWCGSPADIEKALEHVSQAVRYLLQGKDDCVRKATKGFDITPDLKRICPSLTLQQIYKLTEYHHDDWIVGVGGQGSHTIVLLETLKRAVDHGGSGPSSPRSNGSGALPEDALVTSNSGMSSRSWDESEEQLLLDSQAAFVLPKKLLTEAARYFVQAPRSAAATPGLSLVLRIDQACRNMQLPRQLRDRPEFEFLSAKPAAASVAA